MPKSQEQQEAIWQRQNDFLAHYMRSGWTIAGACKAMNMSRGTFYHWFNNDPDFRKRFKETKLDRHEFVYGSWMAGIQRGNSSLIKLYWATNPDAGINLGRGCRPGPFEDFSHVCDYPDGLQEQIGVQG
jgi:hypothetical protein